MEGLCSSQHGGHGLVGYPDDVVLGLLGREAHASRLSVRTQTPGLGIGGPVLLAHEPGPDTPRRTELGDLFEEIVVHVEEEGETGYEGINIEPSSDAPFDIFKPIPQGEGEFLNGRRPCLSDMVSRDRDRVVPRCVLRAPLEHVDDAPQRGFRRKDPGVLSLILLENVVLYGAPELLRPDTLSLGRDYVETEKNDGRTIDGHGDRDLIERDPFEECLHIGER